MEEIREGLPGKSSHGGRKGEEGACKDKDTPAHSRTARAAETPMRVGETAKRP